MELSISPLRITAGKSCYWESINLFSQHWTAAAISIVCPLLPSSETLENLQIFTVKMKEQSDTDMLNLLIPHTPE